MVFFTILVNAPTLTPLIRLLGIGRVTTEDRVAAMQARLLAKRDARLRLLGLRKEGVISREVYDLVTDRYVRAEALLRRDLATIRTGRRGVQRRRRAADAAGSLLRRRKGPSARAVLPG
ncbi:MAG: hypothetical protein WCF44_09475 [Candidatus Methylophosphatis roskildensis]